MMHTTSISDYPKKALKEEEINNRMKSLRKLVLDHKLLSKFRTEDPYLSRFVHCTDFDITLALKRMEDYTNIIMDHQDWFCAQSPIQMEKLFKANDKTILKDRDKNNRAIFVVKLGKLDVANSYPSEQGRIVILWLESIMDDPITQASGLSAVIDMNGFSWRLLKWLTPGNVKILARVLDTYPLNDLLLHIVNTSFLLNAAIKLIWPFLNEKTKKMFKFHFDNWPSLHEYIDPNVLPHEYGGKGPDIDFEKSIQNLYDQDTTIGSRLAYYRLSHK